MVKVKEKKRRRRREAVPEPVPTTKSKSAQEVKDRHGLWVVVSGRMKQYGDFKIEAPGQVIRQQYLRNDDLLLKGVYVRPLQDDEEVRKCKACGVVFIGSVTSGPYKTHLARARHDLAKLDLDTRTSTPDGRVPSSDVAGDPDSDSDGAADWDLEPEGTPPPTRMEQENPGGVSVKLRE